MPNSHFQFKQFIIHQDLCAMKVTTDACLFGAWAAREIKNVKGKINNGLDIGTGTGLLALMLLQQRSIEIDAVEIEEAAARQAEDNIAASPWSSSITVFQENILHFNPNKQYDVIISNPPFYENEWLSVAEEKNTAHHSAHLTLSQVVESIEQHLSDEGIFFLLLPYKRVEEVERLLAKQGLHLNKQLVARQSVNHQPFRVMLMGSRTPSNMVAEEIAVTDENKEYTEAFTALLKDYYLYL
jgi:tRNA1Val (adenine37-N6)-methyltransferase